MIVILTASQERSIQRSGRARQAIRIRGQNTRSHQKSITVAVAAAVNLIQDRGNILQSTIPRKNRPKSIMIATVIPHRVPAPRALARMTVDPSISRARRTLADQANRITSPTNMGNMTITLVIPKRRKSTMTSIPCRARKSWSCQEALFNNHSICHAALKLNLLAHGKQICHCPARRETQQRHQVCPGG